MAPQPLPASLPAIWLPSLSGMLEPNIQPQATVLSPKPTLASPSNIVPSSPKLEVGPKPLLGVLLTDNEEYSLCLSVLLGAKSSVACCAKLVVPV